MPNNDHDYSDNDNSPSDNSPSEGDPDSEDKQATESGTESNSSSKQEQSAESKTSSSFSDSSSDQPSKKRDIFSSKDNGGSPTFPVKLHLILSNPEFEKIVAWLPHGRAWRILDHKALEEKVIPLYFRHGRYSSFARQINGWGFKRIVHGADYNAYYHEMFLRGMPHLCAKMKRPTSKSSSTKEQVDSSDPAPDFYAMSRLQPLPEPGTVSPPNGTIDMDDPQDQADPAQNAGASQSSVTAGCASSSGQSSDVGLEERKSQVLEQISKLLGQNTQHGNKATNSNAGASSVDFQQLSKILEVLNGGQTGTQAAPAPAQAPKPPPVSNQNPVLQQLLAGLNRSGDNNNQANSGQQMNNNFQMGANANPQAQLAALLQQQLQQQTQQQQQQQQQPSIFGALMNQGAQPNNQAALLSSLLSQANSKNGQAPLLGMLANAGGQNQLNPASFLQALSGQLSQQQGQQQSSMQNRQQSSSQSLQQSHDQNMNSKNKAEDDSVTQGDAKRQRQTGNEDVSNSRAPALSQQSNNSTSAAQSPNIAALLGQLSGNNMGGNNASGASNALSQLLSSLSQKDGTSNEQKPMDVFAMLQQQQAGQAPRTGNSAFADVLSLLQQRGNQQNFASNKPPQAPADAFLAALQQQGLGGARVQTQPGNSSNPGSQEAVAGLLQQILGGGNTSQQSQSNSDSSSSRNTGNPVLDALQRLVSPTAQPAPQQAPTNNPLQQLQQLLGGQNQSMASNNVFAAQSRNNGPQLSQDFLSSLGVNQSANNPTLAMLQQLINNNSKPAPNQQQQNSSSNSNVNPSSGQSGTSTQSSSNQMKESQSKTPTNALNQEFLASLGLSQTNHSSGGGSGTGSDRTSSGTSGASAAPSRQSTSSNGSTSMNSELFNAMGLNMNNQSQGESSGNQSNSNESAARSVAAILSAFNQGKNQGS